MRGRDRFLKALLRKEEPDRVPIWELIINEPVIRSLYGNVSYADFIEIMDLDGVTTGEDQRMEKISPTMYKDEWGIIWGVEPSGLSYPLKGPIKDKRDLKNYQPPDPDAPWRLNTLESLVDRFKGDKAIVFLGHEVFEFSHYLLGGMTKLLLSYYKDQELVQELADLISEYKCRVLHRAAKIGADVLLTGDDYANRSGPFVSPKIFEKFVLPYLKRAVNVAKSHGLPFIKHTDGNILPIIDMIISAGIDGLHPIEPAAGMDIAYVKRRYGDKICIIGNIDCSIVLTLKPPEDVEEVVKETIAKVAPGGGYILSSSNSIHPSVKPENFVRMIKAARRYGRYPINEHLIKNYSRRDYYREMLGWTFSRAEAA